MTVSDAAVLLRLTALDLRPLDTAASSARLHVKNVLLAWGLVALASDAELVTSELVANAVRFAVEAAAGAEPFPVRLRLSALTDGTAPYGAQVEVWDAHPAPPERRASQQLDAIGGRGLMIVEALSTRWGCYATHGGGKVVWSVLGR